MKARVAAVVLSLCARAQAGDSPPAAEPPDPSKDGPFAVGRFATEIPEEGAGAPLAATIFYPAQAAEDGAAPAKGGPWPALVFSPGGPALGVGGYDDFATRFASHGFVTLVVAFGDRIAEERAKQFVTARLWLQGKAMEKGWLLENRIDAKCFLAGGHSRGGAAAILAAADPKRFCACLALGPSLQSLPAKYATPTFLVGTPPDAPAMTALHKAMKRPRWLFVVAGLDHFMVPAEKRPTVVSYATAWLGRRFLGHADWKPWIAGARSKQDLADGVLVTATAEE